MPCRMLAEAEARNVWIYIRGDAKSGHCSGVILETGHVLTAGHCAAAIMVVDGKPATVARISVPDDLLLLSVPTETFPPLQINKNPQATEMAYEVSNHNKYRGLVTLGRVVLVNDSEVCVQVLGAPGVSGSAIYDTRGRLMTISTHSHVATFGANASGILFSSGIHPKRVSAFLAAK